MSAGITITVDTTVLERIAANLETNVQKVGQKLGPLWEGYAKSYCPVDTGNLRNSLQATYPGGQVICQLETDVEYGKYQELGFVHWLSGEFIQHAFMQPAAMKIAPLLDSAATWSVLFT